MSEATSNRPHPLRLSSPLAWVMLGLLFVAMVNSYIDRGNISYAIGFISEEFQFGKEARGWVFSIFLLGYALMQIPAGQLVDRFGIKWSYTVGYLIWGLVAATFGLTHTLWQLLALRFMLGVFESVSGPASIAFIARYFDPAHRGLASGIFLAGTKIGPAIGAIVAVYLIDLYGWRNLFVICGLVPLTWLVPWLLGYWLIERAEARGAVESTSQSTATASKPAAVPLAHLLQFRQTWGIYLGYFCYGYTWYLYINWFPSYLQEAHGMSLTAAGWWSAFSYGGLAVVTILAGWFSDLFVQARGKQLVQRMAISAVVLLGLIASGLPIAKYFMAQKGTTLPPELSTILFGAALGFFVVVGLVLGVAEWLVRRGADRLAVRKCFIVTGFLLGALVIPVPFIHQLEVVKGLLLVAIAGTGFATANTWAVTQTVAPTGAVGTMSGIQNFGATSGGFLGPLVTGYLVKATDSYAPALILAGVLMLAGIFSYLFLIPKLDRIPNPPQPTNA